MEHDVPTCLLQHLVFINKIIVIVWCNIWQLLQLWFNIFLSKVHSRSKDLQVMEMNGFGCTIPTCGTRCSNMCSATSGPGFAGQYCFIFGEKIWFRFDHICYCICVVRFCDSFDSWWRSNQFKWRNLNLN